MDLKVIYFIYLGAKMLKKCILSLSVFGAGLGLSISQETMYFPACSECG